MKQFGVTSAVHGGGKRRSVIAAPSRHNKMHTIKAAAMIRIRKAVAAAGKDVRDFARHYNERYSRSDRYGLFDGGRWC